MNSEPSNHEQGDGAVDGERSSKRIKLDTAADETIVIASELMEVDSEPALKTTGDDTKRVSANLPPSRSLLGEPPKPKDLASHFFEEFDVGISEYITKGLPPIHAVIKQRFTDFLVHEVNQDGQVIKVKNLGLPAKETKKAVGEPSTSIAANTTASEEKEASGDNKPAEKEALAPVADGSWHDHYDVVLKEFLSESLVQQLKDMYLEGPEPPFVSDNGWEGRQNKGEASNTSEASEEVTTKDESTDTRGKRGKRGRERGGRGRGRGGRGGATGNREDNRKVLSDPIESKDSRTNLHKAVRELFGGKLESETDSKSNYEGGSNRIVIKWAKRGGGGRGQGERNSFPPYIHFTLQKVNRDTQDALGHLSRMFKTNVKDLAVAGTKDKRAVTVQRVSLKRNGKTVEDIWNMSNNVPRRRTAEEAVTERGERGVRISDLKYSKAGLELGMLKGNVFAITLRNVRVEPLDTIEKALESVKNRGFINYYGMQRFGTASVPTHAIGLALLQSDWHKAVDLILQHRPGEHPEVSEARDAWLIENDLEKALELMPRRVVAERCILESYKKQKGDTRNAMGALSTIPRNLRLMYIHAYQSYVWNAIVSERIKSFGYEKPVVGDIVFDKPTDKEVIDEDADGIEEGSLAEDTEESSKRPKKPWVAPRIKTLKEEDLDKYTIFDVIMPLPGNDVAYPGGALGERYRQFLELDGLDPDNWIRKQKEYMLGGSYRKIIHKPKNLSWTIVHYTDPDVPLAQSDEDELLGFEPPVIDENGKFVAIQVQLELGTASYATMALREITKTDTSAAHQSTLTRTSEDQMFRGTAGAAEQKESGSVDEEKA